MQPVISSNPLPSKCVPLHEMESFNCLDISPQTSWYVLPSKRGTKTTWAPHKANRKAYESPSIPPKPLVQESLALLGERDLVELNTFFYASGAGGFISLTNNSMMA